LNNTDPIAPGEPDVGTFAEGKLGVNRPYFKLIDDFRDGNATSVKSRGPATFVYNRTLDDIRSEAEALRDHNSPFELGSDAPAAVRADPEMAPIPISSVQTRSLIMVIPENHSWLLGKPGFIDTIEAIHNDTDVFIHVIPLRGWRR